jgi:hypothetical protein
LNKVTNFQWGKEAFDCVAAKVCQRGVVEISLDKCALCEKNFLNRPKEANLLGIVVVGLNVTLETTLYHLMVIGDGVKGEQVPEESKEVVHA